MKLLIKKIYNSQVLLKLRNTFGIKKNPIYFGDIKKNFYISDNFLWRVDNGFVTKFIFTDLLNIFYKKLDSKFTIYFYNKYSQLIKTLMINTNNKNELIIDKSDRFFNDFEDYGYFQIFCKINSFDIDENLSNRCYTGFSKNNNNFSFVHGNSYVQANSMNDKENNKYLNLVKTSFIDNQNYLIQNNFESFDLVELFYLNPLDKNISLKINNEDKVDISGHSVYKYVFKNEKIIKFKSNCCFLRPIVFCHKEQYLDVHHG